ncbi:MAG: DNA adenine methylase [Planctomyces sp.]|nr:DNA adenine methylase [Planctomyces sp.]
MSQPRKESSRIGVARATRKLESTAGDSYFGGKGLSFRHLINQIPPHRKLVIPFAGHCAVTRNIRLPKQVYLSDLDASLFEFWEQEWMHPRWYKTHVEFRDMCGIELLKTLISDTPEETFVYCDPPYLHTTRKSRSRYRYEMSFNDHDALITALRKLKCRVMISGYPSKFYEDGFAGWRTFSYQAMTRQGLVTEVAWCNYPEPEALQDYRWLGKDRRERFKLQRRVANLVGKLDRLPQLERMALLDAAISHFSDPAGIDVKSGDTAGNDSRSGDSGSRD